MARPWGADRPNQPVPTDDPEAPSTAATAFPPPLHYRADWALLQAEFEALSTWTVQQLVTAVTPEDEQLTGSVMVRTAAEWTTMCK